MKIRANASILMILLAVATMSSTTSAAVDATDWTSWTTVVKVKVKEWVAYWNGGAPTTAPVPVPVPVAPTPHPAAPSVAAAPAAVPDSAVAPNPTIGKGTTPVPHESSNAVRDTAARMARLRDGVRAHELLKIAKPARAGTSQLPKNAGGVPVTDFAKLRTSKTVARLDIGTEAEISRDEFRIESVGFAAIDTKDAVALATPAPLRLELGANVTPAYGVRTLQGNLKPVGKPMDRGAVDRIAWTMKDVAVYAPLPYRPLDEERLKMVAALVLFAAGDHCHLAMGLFDGLAKAETTRAEATYHLGACAAQLKMHQVTFDELSKVVATKDAEFARPALELMAKDLGPAQELAFYQVLTATKNWKALVDPKSRDLISYRMAKGAFRAKDYATALAQAKLVEGEYADDAHFLIAMSQFVTDEKSKATKTLEELAASIDARKVQDKNIRALVALNLGRLYFSARNYGPALEQYGKVPKDHPLWVQGLIEQGWTQIATEDFSGAIGNMYSLHSPYFRAVYQPESFAVRTIGYLNICQYGDAYRTLTQLEKEYREFQAKTSTYLGQRDAAGVYASVRTYIKGKSNDNVDGVPFQVWREMARRKDFLNLQTALNDSSDESTRYGGVNEKIKSEKASIRAHADAAKKHFDDYRAKIAAFGKDPARANQRKDYEANMLRERDRVIGYRFQLAMLEQSRQGYLGFQSRAAQRLDVAKGELTAQAGRVLQGHARQMAGEMSRVLDNNELLRFEVFAGSGENIRYQVAGGQVGNANRVPASIKPAKMLNWNFDGEFWEDEIGSYRSSLQNNCPTTTTRQANLKHDEE